MAIIARQSPSIQLLTGDTARLVLRGSAIYGLTFGLDLLLLAWRLEAPPAVCDVVYVAAPNLR
jgi:hypothetical protein